MRIYLIISTLLLSLIPFSSMAQELPYREIPAYPEKYTAASVLARSIDGAGYRYYWATEKLREEDLSYKPSEEARNLRETLEHIYSLSSLVRYSCQNKVIQAPQKMGELSWTELREKTLLALEEASKYLIANPDLDLSQQNIIFLNNGQERKFPLWHVLNGPLADVLNHIGQVVSFRRSAGNPQPPGVSVFMGKTRE